MPRCAGLAGREEKMLRFHRLRSVPSGLINSKPTFSRLIFPVQRRPWYDEKGNRRDKGAIGVKNKSSKEGLSDPFRRRKSDFLGSKCYVSILKIMLPAPGGSTFS